MRESFVFRRLALKRLGKLSFLLACMIAIMMAPLSQMALAQKADPTQTMNSYTETSTSLEYKCAVLVLEATREMPGCCNDPGTGPLASNGCDQCDNACQKPCNSIFAVLRHPAKKPLLAFRAAHTSENHSSMLIYKPEAISPPPRA